MSLLAMCFTRPLSTDDLALRSILVALESQRTALDRWLEVWTWLVVIGVFFELVFVIWSHMNEKEEWNHWRTCGEIQSPSKPNVVKLLLELFSVALVVVGIGGELRVDAMLGALETKIRDTNEARVLRLQQEAGEAQFSAEGAADAATKAKLSSDDAIVYSEKARRLADAANGIAKSAKYTSTKAGRAADKAVADANEATTSVDEVSKRTEFIDRYLLSSVTTRIVDRAVLKASLKDQPTGSVEIWYEPYDMEVAEFADQLRESFLAAGWKATDARFSTDHAIFPPTGDPFNSLRLSANETGMAMAAPTGSFDLNSKAWEFRQALLRAIREATGGTADIIQGFPWLHNNQYVIDIGPHRAVVHLGSFPSRKIAR